MARWQSLHGKDMAGIASAGKALKAALGMWRQVDVASREEVLHVMEVGARNRAVAETKMNERSSRSHSVLTVIVDGISHITGQRTHGCLHLIDLAGANSSHLIAASGLAPTWMSHPPGAGCTLQRSEQSLESQQCVLLIRLAVAHLAEVGTVPNNVYHSLFVGSPPQNSQWR